MIDSPQIAQSPEQAIAFIHIVTPRDQIQHAMGPAIGEVMAELTAQGITPAGPLLAHHLRMDPGTFEFNICIPVTSPFAPVGRVQPGVLRAATVARTIYRGPYEGLHAAWVEFEAWIKAEGLTPAADLWERYITGPESSGNPADWRTELNRPLASP